MRREEIQELEEQLKQQKEGFKQASSGLSNTAITAEIAGLKKENQALSQKIEPFKSGGVKILSEKDL